VHLFRQPKILRPVRPRVHLDGAPAEVEAELEGAAGVDPVVVEVGEAHAGRHGGEVRIPERRRQPLGQAHVRCTAGAHLAGGPGLLPRPLLGVVAILGLAGEGRPGSLRVSPPPDVLEQRRVASRGEVHGVLNVGLPVVVVGSADEDHRKRTRRVGHVDVG